VLHRLPNNSFTISKLLTVTNLEDRNPILLLTRKVPHLPLLIPKVRLFTLLALTTTIKSTRNLTLLEEEELMREGKMIKGLERRMLKWYIVIGEVSLPCNLILHYDSD